MSPLPKAVAIVSGGLDSTVMAYQAARNYDLTILSFDYGQKHFRELAYALTTAEKLGAKHLQVNLSSLNTLLAGSALTTSEIDVPEGHYAAENMKATVVPNRNAIMLSIAWGHAVSIGALYVMTAVHAGDHFIYPDCRPEFVRELTRALRNGTEGFRKENLAIWAPFLTMTKADIVRRGAEFNVPFTDTWSCYKGGVKHCGKCGTCVERREAFELAGVNDPTEYEDASN